MKDCCVESYVQASNTPSAVDDALTEFHRQSEVANMRFNVRFSRFLKYERQS